MVRKKQKFGTQKIVALILIIVGISLSLFGSGVFAKSVIGDIGEVKVLEDGTLEITHSQSGQAFILSPTGKSVKCQVDDMKWAGCDTKDLSHTYGIDIELLVRNGANPTDSYIYGAMQSCSGFMFNRCGYIPSECELINGGKCGGTSATTPLLECLSSADCKKQTNGFCNRGKCDYSVVGCSEGQYHCLANGQIWKCINQQLKSVGNCNYIYGVQACAGETKTDESQFNICAKSCVEGTGAGCPNKGDVCKQGTCISQRAQDTIIDLEERRQRELLRQAELKARQQLCEEEGGKWHKGSEYCPSGAMCPTVMSSCIIPDPPRGGGEDDEETEEKLKDETLTGDFCEEDYVLEKCGVVAYSCEKGACEGSAEAKAANPNAKCYVDTKKRCGGSGDPVEVVCKSYEKLSFDGECSFNFNKAFTTGFGEFFGDYSWFLIGLLLILMGAIMFII